MNSKLLIDSIIRQTTVLIAQLSTAAGIRAPLAHLADQVFLNLATEIESQGVGRKVVADMFGLALRSYQKKVQRLTESATTTERTLWESVLDLLKEKGRAARQQIFEHFGDDEDRHVAAVLNDLVNSGLVYLNGRGDSAVYEIISEEDQKDLIESQDADSVAAMVWLHIYRRSQTVEELMAVLPVEASVISRAVRTLIDEGRIQMDDDSEPPILRAKSIVIPVGTMRGWEAAVFDHFRAMANAIAAKVRLGNPVSSREDVLGGATLSFDIRPGHPHEKEVYGLLERVRKDVNVVWDQVSAYNRKNPIPDPEKTKVIFYFGQNVERSEKGSDTGQGD